MRTLHIPEAHFRMKFRSWYATMWYTPTWRYATMWYTRRNAVWKNARHVCLVVRTFLCILIHKFPNTNKMGMGFHIETYIAQHYWGVPFFSFFLRGCMCQPRNSMVEFLKEDIGRFNFTVGQTRWLTLSQPSVLEDKLILHSTILPTISMEPHVL